MTKNLELVINGKTFIVSAEPDNLFTKMFHRFMCVKIMAVEKQLEVNWQYKYDELKKATEELLAAAKKIK